MIFLWPRYFQDWSRLFLDSVLSDLQFPFLMKKCSSSLAPLCGTLPHSSSKGFSMIVVPTFLLVINLMKGLTQFGAYCLGISRKPAVDEDDQSKFFEQNKHWKSTSKPVNNSIYTPKTEEETDEIEINFDQKLYNQTTKSLIQMKETEKETKTYNIKEWLRVTQGADVKNTPEFEIQASLRKGIPDYIRPRVWLWLAGISKNYRKMKLSDVYNELKGKETKWSLDIEKDIPRTYANQDYFQDEKVRKKMYYILKAYANYDQEIGYTQGMNFVVASLMFHMDPNNYRDPRFSYGDPEIKEQDFECKVFWIFVFINYDKNWRLVYKTGTPKALSLVQHLEKRIMEEVPEVYEHMEDNDINVQMSWDQAFITILLYYTPLDFSKRIIDMFLLVGEKIIFDVLVRMLSICKEEILQKDSPEQLHAFLKKEMVDFCFSRRADLCHTLIPQPQTEILQKK